jgi:hypothetical protein
MNRPRHRPHWWRNQWGDVVPIFMSCYMHLAYAHQFSERESSVHQHNQAIPWKALLKGWDEFGSITNGVLRSQRHMLPYVVRCGEFIAANRNAKRHEMDDSGAFSSANTNGKRTKCGFDHDVCDRHTFDSRFHAHARTQRSPPWWRPPIRRTRCRLRAKKAQRKIDKWQPRPKLDPLRIETQKRHPDHIDSIIIDCQLKTSVCEMNL